MSSSDRPFDVALLLGAAGPGLSDGALAASDIPVLIRTADGEQLDTTDQKEARTAVAVRGTGFTET